MGIVLTFNVQNNAGQQPATPSELHQKVTNRLALLIGQDLPIPHIISDFNRRKKTPRERLATASLFTQPQIGIEQPDDQQHR
jgi:hypothetical protein